MVHLADEVDEYGSLDACSAFSFENYMQKLKRLVRSGRNPLAHITKRLSESCESIHQCHEKEITSKEPDNRYILTDSSCCEVVHKIHHLDVNGNEQFSCRVYERTEALFSTPCDSRIIGVQSKPTLGNKKVLSSPALQRKAVMLEVESSEKIFMAILHSY